MFKFTTGVRLHHKKSSRNTLRAGEARHKEAFGTSADKMTFQQGVRLKARKKIALQSWKIRNSVGVICHPLGR